MDLENVWDFCPGVIREHSERDERTSAQRSGEEKERNERKDEKRNEKNGKTSMSVGRLTCTGERGVEYTQGRGVTVSNDDSRSVYRR